MGESIRQMWVKAEVTLAHKTSQFDTITILYLCLGLTQFAVSPMYA